MREGEQVFVSHLPSCLFI
uniref:Uncharacterized protein n=1 Tax=Rhizophora mucronata TaxID=61149 RepID=A0A2P2NXK3_RHIMU